MKLSDYVFAFLKQRGAKHVFMLPGGGAMHLNDSVGRSGIPWTSMLHEQSAAIAAEAFTCVNGDMSVCLTTTGPGATNAVTGCLCAWLGSTPVVFISGQVKRADLRKNGLRQLGVQEGPTIDIVRPITKYAKLVYNPSEIPLILEDAVRIATEGRPGPVWIDIPLDVQAADVPDEICGPPIGSVLAPSNNVIDIIANELKKAKRPVVLLGNGIHLSRGESEMRMLLQKVHAPVLTTRLAADLVPSSSPLCFGIPGLLAARYSNAILQEADLLLILGARMDMALIGYAPSRLAPKAIKIMVNVDTPEINKLGCIDFPIASDVRETMRKLNKQLDSLRYPKWTEACGKLRNKYPFVTSDKLSSDRGYMSMYAFSHLLSANAPCDAIILSGASGNATEICLNCWHVKDGQRIFHNQGTGSLGLAQPAAIGAALASKRTTVVVDGDGGWPMNIQELETVRRLNLPIKFFVVNNNGYASVRGSQMSAFGRLTGADPSSGLSLPSIVDVAKAFGIESRRITNIEEANATLPRVFENDGPVVCEVVVDPNEPREPRVASHQLPDGSWESDDLSDMTPKVSLGNWMANE
jgi:acetolactate synthase I/II/III large subunit